MYKITKIYMKSEGVLYGEYKYSFTSSTSKWPRASCLFLITLLLSAV